MSPGRALGRARREKARRDTDRSGGSSAQRTRTAPRRRCVRTRSPPATVPRRRRRRLLTTAPGPRLGRQTRRQRHGGVRGAPRAHARLHARPCDQRHKPQLQGPRRRLVRGALAESGVSGAGGAETGAYEAPSSTPSRRPRRRPGPGQACAGTGGGVRHLRRAPAGRARSRQGRQGALAGAVARPIDGNRPRLAPESPEWRDRDRLDLPPPSSRS